ncbi:MAG: VWA domain-containing protein [Acidobacteriaceae bacterium]|nr:VWA domain-containing protein [Acidobacteriaceae bacterium]
MEYTIAQSMQQLRGRYILFFPPKMCLLAVLAIGLNVNGQQDASPVSIVTRSELHSDPALSRTIIRTHVKLVLIPVLVTDPMQRPITGLHKQNFRLFEDGVEQNISWFLSEAAPISVGMVFDASNSMSNKLEPSREALYGFLRASFPGDEFSLLKFSDRPEPVCALTTDTTQIENGLTFIKAGGWTALFDAIYMAINQMKRASHGTKVLLIVSDGNDNNSRYTERQVEDLVREADVRIFAISIQSRSPTLERISEDSGGRAYRVRKLDELPALTEALSTEVHSHYVLGYATKKGQSDGKYHRVKVELLQPSDYPRLHVAWRHGYYGSVH